MIRRSALIAVARVISAAFLLATSLYCLLTYNAFAYQQFIRPHLISALTNFTVWHALLYWAVLLMITLTLLHSAPGARTRRAVWIYLAGSAGVGVWLLSAQVLPQVENSRRSLVLALIALVPPFWLAWVDHLAVGAAPSEPSDERRLVKSAVLAAIVTWLTYACMAPFRPRPSGVIAISIGELALGVSSSAIAHLTVLTVIILIAITLRAIALVMGMGPRGEYKLLGQLATQYHFTPQP